MDDLVLQSILGSDKKSPHISLCQVKNSDTLQVYYGVELLETIPSNPDHINYRAAIGRLYNAGLSRKKLSEVFKVDRKTMQKWGRALLTDDLAEAVRILSGRGNYKVTPEIQRFAEVRYSLIYPRNHYSYNKEIREEILATYGVKISSERLRQILNSYKARLKSEGREREYFLKSDNEGDDEKNLDEEDEEPLNTAEGSNLNTESESRDLSNNHNSLPSIETTKHYIHHAGILIFSLWLHKISFLLESKGYILRQWLAAIFLESVNVEQSKYLDFDSLSILLGKTLRPPFFQRYELDNLSNKSLCTSILRLNSKLVNIDGCEDFYYDPHTKHYTGIKNILKGWCPSIRWADKALHSDFIHTHSGEPVYINYFDNYYDLRERYKDVVASFRTDLCIPLTRKITMTIDRGIFSQDIILDAKKEPYFELITWEKGYKVEGQWDESKKDGSFSLVRYRNNYHDTRIYNFSYRDTKWDKAPDIRKLIVCATNPKKKTITVSILCTDPVRDAEEIIRLIFNRWLQENDFKYLAKHFGINQITSYSANNYSQLQGILVDKSIVDGTYHALTQERKKSEKRLKDLLHKKHTVSKKLYKSQQLLEEVEQNIKELSLEDKQELTEWKRKRRILKAKIGLWNKSDIKNKIQLLDNRIDEINTNLLQTTKDASKLDMLVEKKYQRLDIRKKNLMDVMKIYARNIFYHVFKPFKIRYDNFRDDHEYFRNLSHADGIMIENKDYVEIRLNPTAHLQPKTRYIMENILSYLNEKNLIIPDGSGRKLILKLVSKKGNKIAIA
ncbi:MAG: hypothetical protein KGY74_11015 [Candidatus Cloacimonetes bacterium]|nr:hypothetical protein [Candidatus Cloacimonadota bacterium]